MATDLPRPTTTIVAAISLTNSVAVLQAAAVPPYLSLPRNASFAASGFVAPLAWPRRRNSTVRNRKPVIFHPIFEHQGGATVGEGWSCVLYGLRSSSPYRA
jgi:hypothetical protein